METTLEMRWLMIFFLSHLFPVNSIIALPPNNDTPENFSNIFHVFCTRLFKLWRHTARQITGSYLIRWLRGLESELSSIVVFFVFCLYLHHLLFCVFFSFHSFLFFGIRKKLWAEKNSNRQKSRTFLGVGCMVGGVGSPQLG